MLSQMSLMRCVQASSLASLGLQECSSAPSATSAPLPLLLLRHALRGGCPPELCLLPLGLYTHALAFCKERLGCERMSQAAEAAAHAAFEELLALLADAVGIRTRPQTFALGLATVTASKSHAGMQMM